MANEVYTLFSAKTSTGTSTNALVAHAAEGAASWRIQASGTYGAGTTVSIEDSLDGTNWSTLVASIASGEEYDGPASASLLRANVSVHEGGGKTVTIKAILNGDGYVTEQAL